MQEAIIRLNSCDLKVNLTDKVKLSYIVNALCKLGLDIYVEQISMKQTQNKEANNV